MLGGIVTTEPFIEHFLSVTSASLGPSCVPFSLFMGNNYFYPHFTPRKTEGWRRKSPADTGP